MGHRYYKQPGYERPNPVLYGKQKSLNIQMNVQLNVDELTQFLVSNWDSMKAKETQTDVENKGGTKGPYYNNCSSYDVH